MGRKDMPCSGRATLPGPTYPAIAVRAADAEPDAGSRTSEQAGGGDFAGQHAAVLANCSPAQITASLLPYMYRRWHLGCSHGEPTPPARGTSTFSGISAG